MTAGLDEFRLMVDFGFLILIGLVQLIIYPSFTHLKRGNFTVWHSNYSTKISFFVAPLMLVQGGIIALQCFQNLSFFNLLSMTLLILASLHTFLIAVPLHQKIDRLEDFELNCTKLIKQNWKRVFLWTSIWLISLIQFLLKKSSFL